MTELARACPVCERTGSEPVLRKGELQLVRCRECSMIYVNPVRTEFASGSYYNHAADYYLSPAKLESDYASVRFERELALFRKHCRDGAVLDVGASSGGFLFQLQQRFPGSYRTLAMDASGPPLDYAESRGVPVLRGDFVEQDFGDRRFDAITFWAVLEHLLEPKRFLAKAARLLKPGGHCFVLVPNMRSLAARILGARYRYIYPQHVNYFDEATLRKLLEERFAICEMRSTHFNPVVIWQDWRGGGEVSNEDRAKLLQQTTRLKQSALLGPVRIGYKAAERMIGAVRLADNLAIAARKL